MVDQKECKALITQLTQLRRAADELELLLDDEPVDLWEPKPRDWWVNELGKVENCPSVDGTRNLGLDFQTKEEGEAGRLRMYARNRLDAWLREHY